MHSQIKKTKALYKGDEKERQPKSRRGKDKKIRREEKRKKDGSPIPGYQTPLSR
jgi:hypothetical protein